MRFDSKKWEHAGYFALALLCGGGVVSIVAKHGGFDFFTYHYAIRLVVEGKISEIYSNFIQPNHYLYSPGLAVWLSPFGMLPGHLAFIPWVVIQIIAVFAVAKAWMKRVQVREPAAFALALFGSILLARIVVYIFVYGTIDFLIFASCLWALLSRTDKNPSRGNTIAAWALFTLLAIGKPMVAPILMVPWIATQFVDKRVLASERIGQAVGVAATVLPVWFLLGFKEGSFLHLEWVQTLIGRGMPYDTQNQSFAAFLFRWLTDSPVGVLSLGTGPKVFGFGWLSVGTVEKIASVWTALALIAGLVWQRFGRRYADSVTWVAVLLAWVVIPSHIAWKAYFVFGIPAAGLALTSAARWWGQGKRSMAFVVLGCFCAINLSTFDFVGRVGQAYTEALSILFWATAGILACVLAGMSVNRPNR